MSPSESRNGREADSIPEGGILAALPRARPQRASARRAAARRSTATKKGTSSGQDAHNDEDKERSGGYGQEARSEREPCSGRASGSQEADGQEACRREEGRIDQEAREEADRQAAEPPAPKQGYEPEEELELGKSVSPPSGAELVESVADIIGELANSGLTAGGRLLKDAFSLLRRP